MLSKSHRLSRNDIAVIHERGVRKRTSLFFYEYVQSEAFKAGVRVTKQTAKTAVMRNRLRRKLYVVCRKHAPFPAVYILFTPLPAFMLSPEDKIHEAISAIFSALTDEVNSV
jgi:ribonuclease P protein component